MATDPAKTSGKTPDDAAGARKKGKSEVSKTKLAAVEADEVAGFANLDQQLAAKLGLDMRGARERGLLARIFGNWIFAFVLLVVAPSALYAYYILAVASGRYVVETKLTVRQIGNSASLGMDTGLFAGFESGLKEDALQITEFIVSLDMLDELERQLGFTERFRDERIDAWSRLGADSMQEDRLEYFKNHIEVEYDGDAGLINLRTKAYDKQLSFDIARVVVEASEKLVNDLSWELANEKLSFIQDEVIKKRAEYQNASRQLGILQDQRQVLDPQSDAGAVWTVISSLQASIANDEATLNASRSYMSERAAEIIRLKEIIKAKKAQVIKERRKLTGGKGKLNQLMVDFRDGSLAVELAELAYKAALQSLETARVEVAGDLKRLQVIVKPHLPDDAVEPDPLAAIVTFTAFAFLGFIIVSVLLLAVREHME